MLNKLFVDFNNLSSALQKNGKNSHDNNTHAHDNYWPLYIE
jgi:hypothetical protein